MQEREGVTVRTDGIERDGDGCDDGKAGDAR